MNLETYRENMTDSEKWRAEKKLKQDIIEYVKNNFPEYVGEFMRVPVKCNNRLRTRLGSFMYDLNIKKALYLEFNGKSLKLSNELGEYTIFFKSIVIHEILHMVAYLRDKPFGDGDEYFENLLLKYGSNSSGATARKLRKTESNRISSIKYLNKCRKCGKEFKRKNRLQKYTHNHCGGEIYYVKKVLVRNN